MKRIDAFDIARGIAVALVVVLHATLLPQASIDLPQPICRMALLLLISGTLAAPVLTRDWTYARDRGLDLLWLYVLWTPMLLLAIEGPSGLLRLGSELASPKSHLWYIAGLAALIATARLFRQAPAVPVATSAAAALWYGIGGRTGAPGYDAVAHFAVFFFIGLHGQPVLQAALARCGRRIGIAAGLGIAIMLVLPLPHTLVTLGTAGALLLVAQGLARTSAGGWLARMGRRTPDIYLAHGPVLIVAGRALGDVNAATLAPLVVGTVAACLALRSAADRAGLGWLYRRPSFSAPTLAVEATLRPAG